MGAELTRHGEDRSSAGERQLLDEVLLLVSEPVLRHRAVLVSAETPGVFRQGLCMDQSPRCRGLSDRAGDGADFFA